MDSKRNIPINPPRSSSRELLTFQVATFAKFLGSNSKEVTALVSRSLSGVAVSGGAGSVSHGSVKNYMDNEVSYMLQCIYRVLPIGNDQWKLVAELHGIQFPQCSRTAFSIHWKFSNPANQQPGTGDPSIPPLVAMAKETREVINVKAGVSDADVSEFFDDEEPADEVECVVEEQELEEEGAVTVPKPPTAHSYNKYRKTAIYKFW
jgi:hypothetical protein